MVSVSLNASKETPHEQVEVKDIKTSEMQITKTGK